MLVALLSLAKQLCCAYFRPKKYLKLLKTPMVISIFSNGRKTTPKAVQGMREISRYCSILGITGALAASVYDCFVAHVLAGN